MDFDSCTALENVSTVLEDSSNLIQTLMDYFSQLEYQLIEIESAKANRNTQKVSSLENILIYSISRDFSKMNTLLSVISSLTQKSDSQLNMIVNTLMEVRPSEKEHKNSSSSLPTVTSKEKHNSI
ncbi:hypothetical protein ACNAN0_03765 [Agrilactobacillus fermenti]|uniref:hypothetical protein n=1 Tax=Agrilactobacillus fermenti TaxID=2586909 RepID=UPI003A5C27E2